MNACKKMLPALLLLSQALLAACSSGAEPGAAGGKLQTLDMPGIEQHFAANKGKVTLVMFWATWCPACKTEMPVLEQLRAKYPPETLDVMAIRVMAVPALHRERVPGQARGRLGVRGEEHSRPVRAGQGRPGGLQQRGRVSF